MKLRCTQAWVKFHLAILVKPPVQDVMGYTEKVSTLRADDERTILADKCIKHM